MRFRLLLFTLVVAMTAASCSGDDAAAITASTTTAPNPTTTTLPKLTSQSADTPPAVVVPDLYDVSDLVKQARSGVVSVTQERVRLDFSGVPEEVPAGAGTGIVIDETGLVLTNFHVIEGASKVTVTGEDGDQRKADVVAESSSRDLALLQLEDTGGLDPLPLGSLGSVEVGDPVIAIGNALGLDAAHPSVSAGIVAALDRTIRTPVGTMQRLIQTDAAINPGNSGGPLLNGAGEVVGVNTAIAGNAQNVGFAISIDTATQFVERYRLGIGEPFLGVSMVDNSAAAAERFELGTETGALVIELVSQSPAEKAGLEQWDVIVRFDDTDIATADDVVNAVQQTDPGDVINLEVVRGDEHLTFDVTVGERPPGT